MPWGLFQCPWHGASYQWGRPGANRRAAGARAAGTASDLARLCQGFTIFIMCDVESMSIHYSDGYEAYARCWMPSEPRGAVLYLHGIQSHSQWFEASARQLAASGLAVLMPDRRGSGRNRTDRGHVRSAKRWLRDVAECCNVLHVRTGLERFHLVGVSWGGKLALAAGCDLPHRVQSVTLIAPGLFPVVDLPVIEKLKVAWAALVARRRLFDIPLQDPALFTANPDRQAFIRNDALALKKVTAGFLMASNSLDGYLRRRTVNECRIPLKLYLAGHDRIIDNARTRAFVRQLPWQRCEITEYADAHHTLEFEPDPSDFFDDLVAWLDTVTADTADLLPTALRA